MININDYGGQEAGLTSEEIKEYLKNRYNEKCIMNRKKCPAIIYNKFYKIAGVNTGVINEYGEFLMYRHDVERFANVLFEGKETYFD